MIYCTSDTHFFHKKLCYGYDVHFDTIRKYKDIEEMNSDIVRTWNDIVTPNDEVIFLGDFMLDGYHWDEKKKIFDEYWNKLNGKKTWIFGNHDIAFLKHQDKLGGVKIVPFLDIEIGNRMYHFRHEPFQENEITNFNEVYVHGHTHSTNPWNGKQNCACWEAWYAPVAVDVFKTPNELTESAKETENLIKDIAND